MSKIIARFARLTISFARSAISYCISIYIDHIVFNFISHTLVQYIRDFLNFCLYIRSTLKLNGNHEPRSTIAQSIDLSLIRRGSSCESRSFSQTETQTQRCDCEKLCRVGAQLLRAHDQLWSLSRSRNSLATLFAREFSLNVCARSPWLM